MKTKLFMTFVAVLFAAMFASCDKDDDNGIYFTKDEVVGDILTYGELNYMCNEAPIGTKMTFGLYLLNPEQKALQKIDVTFVKVEKPKE